MSEKVLWAERLHRLEKEGGGPPTWELRDYVAELSSEEPQLYLWNVVCDQPEGFVLYRALDREAWIVQCAVRTKGQGRGTLMMRDFLEEAKSLGYDRVGLEVADQNLSARRVYEKLGFIRGRCRPKYYRNGDAAWDYMWQLRES